MQQAQTRLAALTIATFVVGALLWAAFSARFTMLLDAPIAPVAVLSEIAPRPQNVEQVRPEPPEAQREEVQPAPTPAPAAPAPYTGEPPDISNPIWLSRPPSPERFYPRAAFMRGVEGQVTLACFVELDGRLTCTIEQEAPAGQGFGDAALAIARAHVMQPATINGAPVRGRYRMVVPFSLD
ncbi:TonB family protein [Vitreimonas flagellata]|uniref:TonB family protein n=1 Tax=Vitreimonas flagellata TaxID=2560861 RepID=UPI001074DC67|nr:TonB family protein [Vitreimonas flagellata]